MRCSTGPPGAKLMIKNETNVIPKNVGSIKIILRRIYENMN
jgi:hypothetical protein